MTKRGSISHFKNCLRSLDSPDSLIKSVAILFSCPSVIGWPPQSRGWYAASLCPEVLFNLRSPRARVICGYGAFGDRMWLGVIQGHGTIGLGAGHWMWSHANAFFTHVGVEFVTGRRESLVTTVGLIKREKWCNF